MWIGSVAERMAESPERCLRYFRFHGEFVRIFGCAAAEHDGPVLAEMGAHAGLLRAVPAGVAWKLLKQTVCTTTSAWCTQRGTARSRKSSANDALAAEGKIPPVINNKCNECSMQLYRTGPRTCPNENVALSIATVSTGRHAPQLTGQSARTEAASTPSHSP